MKAVHFERIARRLGMLCILGITGGPAISSEPRPVTEAAVMEWVGPKLLTVGTMPAANITQPRSFAVIRPANATDGHPMRILHGTQSYIATPAVSQPSTQQPMAQTEPRMIQRVANFGESYQPEVGPIQINPLAKSEIKHHVVRASTAASTETNSEPDEEQIVQTASESTEPLEFSLSDDSLDDLLTEPELGKPMVDDSLVLKNREASLPPTLVKPGAKTFLVAEAGANSSIKLPRLPLVNDVLAAEDLNKKNAIKAQAERLPIATEPVDAELDPAIANSDRTEIIRRTTKLEPRKPESATVKIEPALDVATNPYLALLPVDESPSTESVCKLVASPFSSLGEEMRTLRLRKGDVHRLTISGITQVILEDPELCDVSTVDGNILLLPKQSGVTRVALLESSSSKGNAWFKLNVESTGPVLADRVTAVQLQQLVANRFANAKVFIEATSAGILVRGETENEDHAKTILSLVRQACLCPVIDQLTIH